MKRSIVKVVFIALLYYLSGYSKYSSPTRSSNFSSRSSHFSTYSIPVVVPRLSTRGTRLSICLSTRSTRLSTRSICLSTRSTRLAIRLSTPSTRSTICQSFCN